MPGWPEAKCNAGGENDACGGAERRQPAPSATVRAGLRCRDQLGIQRAMRHGAHRGIEPRIRLGLRQFAIERSEAGIVPGEKSREFSFLFFVAAHSANFSRSFANA